MYLSQRELFTILIMSLICALTQKSQGRAFAVWRGVELAALPFKQVSSGRQSQTLSENEKVGVGALKDEVRRLMTRFGLLEDNIFHR